LQPILELEIKFYEAVVSEMMLAENRIMKHGM
jgi:hypothetical protein